MEIIKTLQEISGYLPGVKWHNANSFQAKCPCHDDRNASLTVSDGDTGGIVFYCHAGCSTENIINAVGLTWADITPQKEQNRPYIVAKYCYSNGTRKLRYSNKSFIWQHETADGWRSGRNDAPHVLYTAGEPKNTVYICEGEKDADNVAHKLSLYAVSPENGAGKNSGGGKWYKEYNADLSGKIAVLLPDNDSVGQDFMQLIASEISDIAVSVKVIDLKSIYPKLPEHGDISDIIEKIGSEKTQQLLSNLVDNTPEWVPFTVPEPDIFSEFGLYSVPDLTEAEKQPPEFIIDGMIPVGLTFFSGAPKIRKSFFALQAAICVATGTPFLGHSTKQCDVVYLDLEGSKSRISERTRHMSVQIPRNVFVTNSVKERLADGLTEKLRTLHRQHPLIRLVVVDTYSRARGSVKANGSSNAYDQDVLFLEPIQRMAIEENIAIVFVHHDKKGAGFASDSFERLSGTMGISGSSDAVLNLVTEGKRWDGRATLEYTPRDAKGGEMNLVFDDFRLEWQTESVTKPDISGNAICRWILENPPEPRTVGDFISYESLLYNAFHTYSNKAGDIVRESIEPFKAELITDYNLAIQMGVKQGGKRGMRIISLV